MASLRTELLKLARSLPTGADRMALLRLAGKQTVLKADLRLKDGTVYPRGTAALVEFSERQPSMVEVEIEGRRLKLRTTGLHQYFNGFTKPPGRRALEKMVDDAVATTVTGQRGVEPDGYGRDGSPSWILAMGLI